MKILTKFKIGDYFILDEKAIKQMNDVFKEFMFFNKTLNKKYKIINHYKTVDGRLTGLTFLNDQKNKENMCSSWAIKVNSFEDSIKIVNKYLKECK